MYSLFLAGLLLILSPAYATDEEDAIGYNSVREALDDLRDKPGAVLSIQGDWSVISNSLDNVSVLWSFTSPAHYAFPSVARREVIEEDGKPVVETNLLCEASVDACDQLLLDFQNLDRRLNSGMQQSAGSGS